MSSQRIQVYSHLSNIISNRIYIVCSFVYLACKILDSAWIQTVHLKLCHFYGVTQFSQEQHISYMLSKNQGHTVAY